MANADVIRAREQLDLIHALSCAMQGKDGVDHRMRLAMKAFEDDEMARVTYLEALTRR